MDTIYALASARGRAGVAVLRVSGPQAFFACEKLAGDVPAPRHASLRRLSYEGEALDDALVLVFEPGASFTGEAVVEFQLHGGPAVVSGVLGALGKVEGLRLAEPGEFTRRALENDRLSLAEVEGLADLIDAETEAQRRQAFRLFDGALGAKVEAWRADLVRAAALTEATIDFADEDVPEDVSGEVAALLDQVRISLAAEIAGSRVSERLRDGFEVAIVGRPNVGKSTLLNNLAGREAAITSDLAGTTRDVIEVRMDLSGLPVTFLDTAGLRETQDRVEAEGVTRALARAAAADLRLVLLVPGETVPDLALTEDDMVLGAKSDLSGDQQGVSGKTGAGLDRVIDHITSVLSRRLASSATATRERHREHMADAVDHIRQAETRLNSMAAHPELVAHEIRSAARDLDSLIGRLDVEDILDVIFASFCLGK